MSSPGSVVKLGLKETPSLLITLGFSSNTNNVPRQDVSQARIAIVDSQQVSDLRQSVL